MEKTNCGPQPHYENFTLGLSGWELVPYHPCYWKGNLVNINGKPYTHRDNEWQEVKPNMKMATHHLIYAFNHSVNKSSRYINTLNPAYRATTLSHGDLMAELLSVMAEHQLESNNEVHVGQIVADTVKEKRLSFVYSWITPLFSTFWIIVAVFVFLTRCYFCDWHILLCRCLCHGTSRAAREASQPLRA